jgi:hypothetical protein
MRETQRRRKESKFKLDPAISKRSDSHSKLNEHTVKATFTNIAGREVKENIHTFRDGQPGELLIEVEKQLLKLGNRYKLFQDGKWEELCELGG